MFIYGGLKECIGGIKHRIGGTQTVKYSQYIYKIRIKDVKKTLLKVHGIRLI